MFNNELLLHGASNIVTCYGLFFPDGIVVYLEGIYSKAYVEIGMDILFSKNMNGNYGMYLPNTLYLATPKIDFALDSNDWYSVEEVDYEVYHDNYMQLNALLRQQHGISIHEDAFTVSFREQMIMSKPKVHVGSNLNAKAEISPSNPNMIMLSNPVIFRSVDSTIPTDAQPALNIAYVYDYY